MSEELDRPADETATNTIHAVAGKPSSPSHLTQPSHVVDEGRFIAGTLLAGRYRIVGLLGKGGMGEVYRATDLTLGQSVALKFLPAAAADNSFLLERFHGEVRIARQISHPNVCRVYDIGEAEGMPYLSMEYVDGEDLASLLPRIGRLPADRAITTARKICAGLAAAHAKGVIHRDLKPHNIMMDKRGEIVIMDFGLAAIADQLSGPEARNGTPAYMSPEQLKGTEVTSRSDIYALGLVLYEIFTGRRPYEARSVRDLIALQESGQLTAISSIAADVDEAVERVIRRCLDPDPLKRPATALSVAAALPGGDPLAAALAAGETPSAELVAASGKTEGMPVKYMWLCVAALLASIVAMPILKAKSEAAQQAPFGYSAEVLAQKARDMTASFGYKQRPVDTSARLTERLDLITYIDRLPQPRNFKSWLALESPVFMIYRESQEPLLARPLGNVTETNPPLTVPGSVKTVLEAGGRLREFRAMPYAGSATTAQTPAEAVWRAMGFDPAGFSETAPTTLPTVPTDTLKAWKGPHPSIPGLNLQAEIGWWKGQLTWVAIVWPWTRPLGPSTTNPMIADLQALLVPFCAAIGLLFAVLLARRNWRLDRADRSGAYVMGLTMFSLVLASWVMSVHVAPSGGMTEISVNALLDAVAAGALYLVLYLALEPAVRLRWPHSLITWSRLLSGRWSDSQVASQVLIGIALGAALSTMAEVQQVFSAHGQTVDSFGGLFILNGTRFFAANFLSRIANAVGSGVLLFFVIFGLRSVLRKDWLAALAGSIIFSVVQGDLVNSVDWQLQLAIVFALVAALVFALLRFGLLVTVVAVFATNTLGDITLGTDWSAWYAPYGVAVIAFFLLIAGVAFRNALGERELV